MTFKKGEKKLTAAYSADINVYILFVYAVQSRVTPIDTSGLQHKVQHHRDSCPVMYRAVEDEAGVQTQFQSSYMLFNYEVS